MSAERLSTYKQTKENKMSGYLDCPKCDKENFIEGEDFPETVCDDEDFECVHCEHEFSFGWYALLEIRDDKLRGK